MHLHFSVVSYLVLESITMCFWVSSHQAAMLKMFPCHFFMLDFMADSFLTLEETAEMQAAWLDTERSLVNMESLWFQAPGSDEYIPFKVPV